MIKKQLELLTKEQVAAKLNLSLRSIYRMAEAGKIPPPVKFGGAVRWRSDVIDDWIENDCKPVRKN